MAAILKILPDSSIERIERAFAILAAAILVANGVAGSDLSNEIERVLAMMREEPNAP